MKKKTKKKSRHKKKKSKQEEVEIDPFQEVVIPEETETEVVNESMAEPDNLPASSISPAEEQVKEPMGE